MSKYKVGDKVRIRLGLENRDYGMCACNEQMAAHGGEVVTVKSIHPRFKNWFKIEESLADCMYSWHWSDEMVEPYMEEKKMFTKSDLKTGMFDVMDNGFKFVVVGDSLIYSNGEWDRVSTLDENLEMFSKKVMKVYDNVVSFNNLERTSNRPIYDRERDTKKLYNGKVVCIGLNVPNNVHYTVGKIYEFKDGRMTTDYGYRVGGSEDQKFYSLEDFVEFTSCKFIEVVE